MELIQWQNVYFADALSVSDIYFNERLDSFEWFDTDNNGRERALLSATRMLEGEPWSGCVLDLAQLMAFPRVGCYQDNRLGTTVSLGHPAVERRLKIATLEIALHLIKNQDLLDDVGSIKGLVIGTIELEAISKAARIPPSADREIACLRARHLNTVWRAN